MKYILGIITQEKEPFVVMQYLDKDGNLTGEQKLERSIEVKGTLMSNKNNQLVFKPSADQEIGKK